MPTEAQYKIFSDNIKPSLIELLKALQPGITNDRACNTEQEDPDYLEITIACNADLKDWCYQTGDNSFSGACYHRRHWGIGTITNDCNLDALANSLINDMLEQLSSSNDASLVIENDQIADS